MPSQNNIRLFKNTVLLYIRTFAVLIVSLYTSRLILASLGITDLGIYNLVGSIVMLMSFLQGAQVKATSRFITYGLGNEKNYDQSRMYSLCMTIHILIVILVIIIAETFGLWIINNCTDIPQNRQIAANVVYQFSIITFSIQFIRSTLDSIIIAYEKMSVYAYMSIIEVGLQLMIVLLLNHINYDSLMVYSALLTLVAICIFLYLYTYVRLQYKRYKFIWLWDNAESIRILTFSGWTLLGSSANTATQQGVSILMNNYIGLLANAALGFANQINVAINKFINSFTTAFNPQIIKYYANNELQYMHSLMTRASKISFILCYVIAFPLMINMHFIISVWLGNTPIYTVEFCQMILVCAIFDATTGVFNTSISATGEIKKYQIWITISFLTDLLCAYFFFELQLEPVLVFGSRILTRGVFNMVIGLHFCHIQLDYSITNYLKTVLVPISIIVFFSLSIPLIVKDIDSSVVKFICSFILCFSFTGVLGYFLLFDFSERKFIWAFLRNKYNNIKNEQYEI